MSSQPISVAVLHGGPSTEHDISVITSRGVIAALRTGGHEVHGVYVDRDGLWHFAGTGAGAGVTTAEPLDFPEALARLRDLRVDAAFLGFHGVFGEDGRIQAALDLAGVPYTGSAVTASALAMDKHLTRRVFADAGLEVALAIEVPTEALADEAGRRGQAERVVAELGAPVVVKVPAGGSSVGIEIPADAASLAAAFDRLRGGVELLLCEQFVSGVELTAGVLADGERLQALPIVEIAPKDDRWFDYETKYDPDMVDEIVPARVPAHIEQRCRDIGLRAHRLLGCHGVSRTDLIWDGGGSLVVLETNTLPGLTPASLLPKAAAAVGCSYLHLLRRILAARSKS